MTDLEAKKLALAEKWWVKCNHVAEQCDCHADCAACHGTGKIYPLRKPCLCLLPEPSYPHDCETIGGQHCHRDGGCPCLPCNDRGWLPNVTLETMLEAAFGEGYQVTFYYPVTVRILTSAASFVDGFGPNVEEAFLDAMLQVAERGMK